MIFLVHSLLPDKISRARIGKFSMAFLRFRPAGIFLIINCLNSLTHAYQKQNIEDEKKHSKTLVLTKKSKLCFHYALSVWFTEANKLPQRLKPIKSRGFWGQRPRDSTLGVRIRCCNPLNGRPNPNRCCHTQNWVRPRGR